MNIKKKIKGIRIELLIVSAALFALGLFLVIFPRMSQDIICRAIGIALCVWGVLRLITYFRVSREEVFSSFGLVQGVSLLAAGVFFVMNPRALAVFFGAAISVIIIIDGILKLQYGIEFYHMHSQRWWIDIIGSAIMVILGIVAFFNPFGPGSVLTIFCGIILMCEGAWDFVSIVRITKFAKDINDSMQK